MRILVTLLCLFFSWNSYSQVFEGSGPSPESAFINACITTMDSKFVAYEGEVSSRTLRKTEQRLDTAIGNLVIQYMANHIDSNASEPTGDMDYQFEEVFKILYSDDLGRSYKMDCSVLFDEDNNNFASIERLHTQTFNMTFEGVLEYLQTQGYEIKHRTEQPPYKSLLQEPIHYISIEYKKP